MQPSACHRFPDIALPTDFHQELFCLNDHLLSFPWCDGLSVALCPSLIILNFCSVGFSCVIRQWTSKVFGNQIRGNP